MTLVLEPTPDSTVWGWEVDQLSRFGKREELQLVRDAQAEPAQYLLIRRLEELGDSLQEVSDRIAELEALGVQLIEQPYNSSDLGQSSTAIRTDLLLLLQEIQRASRSRRMPWACPQSHQCPPTAWKSALRLPARQEKSMIAVLPSSQGFFDHFLLYSSLGGSSLSGAKNMGRKSL